jgi:DNA (cytosine-5)-methyltransferase 1
MVRIQRADISLHAYGQGSQLQCSIDSHLAKSAGTLAKVKSESKLKVISLFTGVGGLDFGFEAAGFRTTVAVDLDPATCDTLRYNRDWPVLEGGIHDIASKAILRTAELDAGDADVLIGGPPCQPFSKAGYWKLGDARRMRDPRSETLVEYLRVLRDTRPKVFLLENVPGLVFAGKDEGLRYLLNGIKAINKKERTKYSVSCHRVNAADFGVPQNRERVFLVGFRDGRAFDMPPRSHGELRAGDFGLIPYTTAWDAIGKLHGVQSDENLALTGKWSDLLSSIPEGHNYLWHTDRGGGTNLFGWRTRYWSFLLKLAKNRPSWTIQAQPGPAIGPFHWSNRRLSIAELCRLQTLPENIRFRCGRTEAQRLLGNAVPSLLAEVFAQQIRRQLLEVSRPQKRYRLSISCRGEPPPPEPVDCVPNKYLHLKGRHADHPGEGKGRGAALLLRADQ